MHFITFHPCCYNSLWIIPQPLGNLHDQVARKHSSLLSSLLCAHVRNLYPAAHWLRASLQSGCTATAYQYNLFFLGFWGRCCNGQNAVKELCSPFGVRNMSMSPYLLFVNELQIFFTGVNRELVKQRTPRRWFSIWLMLLPHTSLKKTR